MVRKNESITEKILEHLINNKTLNSIKIAFICFTLLLSYISLSSAVAEATTYYVATNGNDNNPGTEQSPWRTIQHAANTLNAGDTVYVKSGTYKEHVVITRSGSSDNYTTFQSYPGETATIDARRLVGQWDGAVHISSANYINFVGFNIINSGWDGIRIDNNNGTPSSYINIQGNSLSNIARSGILAITDKNHGTTLTNHITFDGNTITNTQTAGSKSRWGQQNENVDMINVIYFEIKNNNIYNTANYESIDVKEGSSYGSIHHNLIIPKQSAGIYIDSQGKNSTNIDIYNNWIHDGVRDFTRGIALATENGGSLRNVTVYNNIVFNNPAIGIAIASYSDGPIDNVTISSNTVYNNGLKVNWGGGIVIEYVNATNVKIVNNIAYQNMARGNIVTDNGGNSTLYTNLYKNENPLFVNASNQSFHLQSLSPAINNGSSPDSTLSLFVPTFDFDNVPRPQGTYYDIGAYEYKSSS